MNYDRAIRKFQWKCFQSYSRFPNNYFLLGIFTTCLNERLMFFASLKTPLRQNPSRLFTIKPRLVYSEKMRALTKQEFGINPHERKKINKREKKKDFTNSGKRQKFFNGNKVVCCRLNSRYTVVWWTCSVTALIKLLPREALPLHA